MLDKASVYKFANIFSGRTDAYGGLKGVCIKKPVTSQVYAYHLAGKESIGIYPLLDDGTCHFAAIDVDLPNDQAKAAEMAGAVKETLIELGIPAYVEISKSKGYHVWVFFAEPVPAKDARWLLTGVWKKAVGGSVPELFPKQDNLNGQTYGNYINLPYFPPHSKENRRVMVDGGRVLSLEEFLNSVKRVKPEQLFAALEKLPVEEKPAKEDTAAATGSTKTGYRELLPCAKSLVKKGADKGYRRPSLFRLAAHCHKAGYPQEIAEALIRQVDAKNDPPILKEFGEKELLHHLENAYSGKGGKGYTSLGCDDAAWTSRFCPGKESCPVYAKEARPKTTEAVPTAEPEAEAKEIKFPESAYCGLAAEFAELFSQYTEVPKASYYVTFLCFLGLLLSGKITLQSQLDIQPRLYVVILGKTGVARKSEAIKQTAKFFTKLIDEPGWYPMMTGVGSVEGAADKWAEEENASGICRCLLVFDELKIFVDKAKQNGSILLSMITSLFEQNSYENITRSFKTVSLRNLHLGLVSACTIETYERMWEPQFLDIGFINRLFLVADMPDKRIALPDEIPGSLINPLREKTFKLIQKVATLPGVLKLTLTPEAKEAWSKWYEEMPRDIYSVRLDSIGLRLMPLLAVNTGDLNEVSIDVVKKVIAILDYQYQVRKLYDPVDAETKTAIVEEKIRRQLETRGPMKKKQLQQYTHANRYGIWFFRQALENLQYTGEIWLDGKTKLYHLTGK